MKPNEISDWDLKLIKAIAEREFVDTSTSLAQCYFNAMLGYLEANGFDVVKTDREPTWSKQTDNWYIKQPDKKNWW